MQTPNNIYLSLLEKHVGFFRNKIDNKECITIIIAKKKMGISEQIL